MYKWLPGAVPFEYLKTLPRCRTQREFTKPGEYEDVGRRMTTGFGPWKFFISQWPEVPEQLFLCQPSRSSSSLQTSLFLVIPCALVTLHVYPPCVRNSDTFGLFSGSLSFVLVSDVIRPRLICNFLGTPARRLSRLFNYLASENIRKTEDKILSCAKNKNTY